MPLLPSPPATYVSHRRRTPFFPTEIAAMIISEITHDKSLAACSLVSHTWNALARPQQFNTLCFDLDSERSYRSFATNTTTEHMGKKMTIRQAWYLFLDFLHDSPHICELVKALVLLYAGNATQRVADDEVFLFIHDIKDVVHYLPELRSLDIVSSDMWSLPGIPPLLPLPPPIQHELQAVHIGKHWDSNIDHIGASRLFCSMVPFVHSRSIALTGYIVCHPFRLPDASSFQPWSALETLSLRDNLNVDTFLAALRSMTSFFLALRRLDIGYIAPRGQQETWDLLHAFSGQLTHVGLQHRYLRSDLYHEPFTTFDWDWKLPPLPHVTTLRFIIPSALSRKRNELELQAWEHALSMLLGVSFPLLSDVVFEHASTYIQYKKLPCDRIKDVEDRLLEIPGLRQVRFEVGRMDGVRGEPQSLSAEPFKRWFPELHARHILRVV